MTININDSNKNVNTLIISGGKVDIQLINEIDFNQFSNIIAVDSGANILYETNIIPDILLGDFDSIDKKVLNFYENKQIPIIYFSKHKDKTDTEIALDYAVKIGTSELFIIGAFGTRMDHTLSNLLILEKYIDKMNCKLLDLHNLIQFIKGPKKINLNKSKYKYISIIPISEQITGVTTYGLKYPLDKAVLSRKDSLGISNEIVNEKGAFSIDSGKALIVQSID